MSDDPWTQQKWKRDIERFLEGRKCPMCASARLLVRDQKVVGYRTNATQPVAEVWCDDCGYLMTFVVS